MKKRRLIPSEPYKAREEALNSATHAIAAVLSLVGAIILVSRAVEDQDGAKVISFAIFGASLFLLYLSSTVYHGTRKPRLRRVFKVLDHAAIFGLIAGSYTPFLMVAFRGPLGWTYLGLVWGLALLGIGFKVFFIQWLPRASVLFYVILGWLSIGLVRQAVAVLPMGSLVWLAAGGLAYTLGVPIYLLKKTPYMHLLWHLFVMAGSTCHYLAVLLYLAPMA